MERVGFLLKVREEMVEEYKNHHRAVWPDMLGALRRNGWRNYSLFMADDGTLFGYFEADESFQASLDGMSKEAVNTPLANLHGRLLRDGARDARRKHSAVGTHLLFGVTDSEATQCVG